MTTYTIKPLMWLKSDDLDQDGIHWWYCHTIFGTWYVCQEGGKWHITRTKIDGLSAAAFESPECAQAAAFCAYAEMIEQALEVCDVG